MAAVGEMRDHGFSRRRFLSTTSVLSAASLLGVPWDAAAEPPPEVTKIRLVHTFAICLAPQYLAEELLRLEGFAQVEYVDALDASTGLDILAGGGADISMWDALTLVVGIDVGKPLLSLAGIHAGCWELFGKADLRAIRDLKGRSVAIQGFGSGDHILLSSMLAYVGMDPRKDINWIAGKNIGDAMRLFIDGQADAFFGFAPQPQELRAKGIGRVIVDTANDRPWSQYFCCMVNGNRDFVHAHPVATKRALRAILKAADICALDPQRAARYMVAKGYEPKPEIALEVITKLPYRRWREADPEDTLRFHALRLHEVGMIKNTPQKLIAQGTDWRFLNELKRELKA